MSEDKIITTLKHVFHHDTFKSEVQENSIREIVKRNKDVIVSMPTGSGKSLCYQLPAVLFDDKVALVFSPLLALIKDQIDHLSALKIKACSLNSKMTKKDRESVINDLRTNVTIRLLYITPEQAATKTFRELYISLLKNKKVSFLVIDEAHCISQWGHDFRPDYLKLSELRMDDSVPCIALTATAGPQVLKDITLNLKLTKNYETYKVSCFRKNLFYDVVFRNLLDNPYDHLCKFIHKCIKSDEEDHLQQCDRSCGIIYCRTRQQTEEVAHKLTSLGIPAFCYHSGLNTKDRLERQEKWQSGEYPVICATISFGMGVDKASVRFVIHWGVAKDPASYYQESGRAGRDSKRSFCRLYYDRSDQKAIEFHLKQDLAKALQGSKSRQTKAEHAIDSFSKIVEYCESARLCRHRLFTDHFGDSPPVCKKNCDICKDKEAAEKQVEAFLACCIQYSTKASTGYDDCSDLYEGGRGAITRDDTLEDSEGSSYEREKQAKRETEDLIRKQFALRRVSQSSNSISSESKHSPVYSRVKAAESTTVKVAGLTVPIRDQNVEILAEILNLNYSSCKPSDFEHEFEKPDFEDCAVGLEYNVFTSKTNMTMYRASIAKLVMHIKKCTQSSIFFDALANHTPQPRQNRTIKDMFYNIKKQHDAEYGNKRTREIDRGFQSAKQMLESRMKKFKHDKTQSKLNEFFKTKAETVKSKDEEPKHEDISSSSPSLDSKHSYEDSDDEKMRIKEQNIINNITKADRFIKEHKESSIQPAEVPDVSYCSKSKSNVIHVSYNDTNGNDNKSSHKTKEEHRHLHKNSPNSTEKQNREEKINSFEENEKQMKDLKIKREKNKQKIGQFIVQLLMPAYTQKKFQSKDVFKSVARKITHDVMSKDLGDESNIKLYVNDFVKKHKIFKETVNPDT